MIVLQHLLVILLAVGLPLWDWYEIPRLKASTEPRKKIRYYSKIVTLLWILAFVVVVAIGLGPAFIIRISAGEIGWLDRGSRGAMLVEGIAVGMLIAIFVPALLAMSNQKLREKSAKAAKKLSFLLPSTGAERHWWWLVCLTAGTCEEIIYRGFLLHYFHTAPFHWSLTRALIMASIIFGIGHLYQGLAGAASTVIIGFVFGCIFLLTGSLLIPMVLHAALDLRVLMMLPEGFETAEAKT
jgi:uncharacterized protein